VARGVRTKTLSRADDLEIEKSRQRGGKPQWHLQPFPAEAELKGR